MNQKLQDLMYHSGLTAQGCWDEMDEYDKQAIEKFGKLIVQECLAQIDKVDEAWLVYTIEEHFGVENERT